MPSTAQEQDNPALPHYKFISTHLPDWLTSTTPEQRAGLRSALLKKHTSGRLLKNILTQLKSIEAFAEPILELDIRARSPELSNLQVATLSKRWKKDSFLGVPIYDTSPEHTLLEAALYNFEAWETSSSAFGRGSAIYRSGKAAGLKSHLKPEVFAQHCRNLDLGQQYHYHLKQILDLNRPADEIMIFHEHTRDYFLHYEQHCFNVTLLIAHLQKKITDACAARLSALLSPTETSAENGPVCYQVKLLNITLPGVIHFSTDPDNNTGHCTVYFPGHPTSPLQAYPSLLKFQEHCLEQLKSKHFRQQVSQLMPLGYQGNLLAEKLMKAYSQYSRTRQPHTNIISVSRIAGDVFEAIHRQRLQHLESDIDRLACPSASANASKREKLLEEYQDAHLDLLATLKNRIPTLRKTLLRSPSSQMATMVYQDLTTWAPEKLNAGLMHLLNVAEAAAGGQITQKMHAESARLPQLIAIRFQGRTRLWKPDLTPYQLAIRLPDNYWQANALGLYTLAHSTYLKLDQSYYEIEYRENTHRWHIVMPGYPDLYSPPLQHNCVGAWRTIHEDVRQWSKLQLIRRLGPRAARLPEPLADAALLLSGTRLHTLQQLHQYSRRPPALLLDNLKRLWIYQEIESFDLDRAKGNITSELSPRIQSYLLTSLPDWPRETALKIIGNDSRVSTQYGDGENVLSITEKHWVAGKLLSVVLQELNQEQIHQLLDVNIPSPDQLNQLALNLATQAKLKKSALLEHLYTVTEKPDTPAQQQLRDRYPELPKSHLADADFFLDKLGTQTPPLLHREIDRALELIRISRVLEGLYPDWPDAQQSDRLAFSLLETLPAWPQDIRLELWDHSIERAAPLESIGASSSLAYRRLKKMGTLYELQDKHGTALSPPRDLHTAIWLALPSPTRLALNTTLDISLDEAQAAKDLKQALFRQVATLRNQTPAIRTLQRLPEGPAPADATGLPEKFAVPGTLVSGLALRDGGIYWNFNNRPRACHAHLHYILEGNRYYPVRRSLAGWRLLNARAPYSFYQPLLQRKADGGWALHPATERVGLKETDSLQVPTSNSGKPDTPQETMFTDDERRRMLSPKSYRSSLNSPFTYDRVDNARYPLRDLDGHPMLIVAIHYSRAEGSPQSLVRAREILPYLTLQGHEKVARLYEDKLAIKRFECNDKQSEQEDHLIGRYRVNAKRYLRKGEILGVYGGMLIPLIISHHRRDVFATWVQQNSALELIRFPGGHPQPALPCLSGDNILSRVNTLFEYEGNVPVRQAATGYNVEPVAFPVDIIGRDGSVERNRYFITALFASQAIRTADELRMNHGYTEEQIQALRPPPQASSPTAAYSSSSKL